MANSFLQMNAVLTYDIINQEHALLWINLQDFQGLQDSKVEVFLLFTLK